MTVCTYPILLIAVLLAHGRAAILSLAVALAAGGLAQTTRNHSPVRISAAILAAPLIVGAGLALTRIELISDFMLREQRSDQFLSLTGRRYFWDDVVVRLDTNFLTGSGYGSFFLDSRNPDNWGDTHNAFLQALYEVGAVGLALFVAMLIYLTILTYRRRQNNYLLTVVFIATFSVSSSSAFVPGALHGVLALTIALAAVSPIESAVGGTKWHLDKYQKPLPAQGRSKSRQPRPAAS
jgi:O-antigen ligase